MNLPPLVAEMIGVFVASAAELRGEISNVKPLPFAPGMSHEAISFELRGCKYHAVLRGRNSDFMIGHGEENDQAIAVRCLLDGDAEKLPE